MALTPTSTSQKGLHIPSSSPCMFFQCLTIVSVGDGHMQGGCVIFPRLGGRNLGSCCRDHPPLQLLHTSAPRWWPLHVFWETLHNLQLRPLALFSTLTEGLSWNKNTVQLFGSRFQEMNLFVNPRLSGQAAKIMNSFTVENKIKEQKYRQ